MHGDRLFERIAFCCDARLIETDWFKGEWSTLRICAMLEREWRAGAADRRQVRRDVRRPDR